MEGPETGLCATHIFLGVDDPFHMKPFNEAIRQDLIRQGFKYIFTNLDDSAEVEKNRKKRHRQRVNSPA